MSAVCAAGPAASVGSSVPLTIDSITTWGAAGSRRYDGAGADSLGVNSTMICAYYLNSVPAIEVPCGSFVGAAGGTEISFNSGQLRGISTTAAAGAVITPVKVMSAADVGKIKLTMVVRDTTVLRLVDSRVSVGTTPMLSAAGYLPGANYTVGNRGGGGTTSFNAGHWLFSAQFTGAASQAEWEAYYDAFKASGAFSSSFGSLTLAHAWKAAAGSPATLSPIAGGVTLTKSGTPLSSTVSTSAWDW